MLENKWHLGRKSLVPDYVTGACVPPRRLKGIWTRSSSWQGTEGGQGMKGRDWLYCVLSARESAGEPRQQWPKDS